MRKIIFLSIFLTFFSISYANEIPDNRQESESETIESLQKQLDAVKKSDSKKRAPILEKMFELMAIEADELQSEVNTLKSENEQLKKYEKEHKYLTTEALIFTTPLPDSTEVHPALRPLVRAIGSVTRYASEIRQTNEMLDSFSTWMQDNRSKTYQDFVNTSDVQNQLTKLININSVIDNLDLTIFSDTQKKYIEGLQSEYNTIIEKVYQ